MEFASKAYFLLLLLLIPYILWYFLAEKEKRANYAHERYPNVSVCAKRVF